ncbi:hypothetical protein [Paenibacillus piri]|uniref:Cytosolic protein n=1 Tax=Paenibacillus piri TaxID=2547395 RepID=A0A4R5KXC1_9BACL|nr:hypothetical protein [Paenibacillus piri]TDG00477.1 hypothetical protein E1757_02265 [Paenibacillus piri]
MISNDDQPFKQEEPHRYTDLDTVESQRNELIPEEFPEGPYGSDVSAASLGKNTPWREDQRPVSAYTYENRELHAGLSRGYPGDHPTHDDEDEDQA